MGTRSVIGFHGGKASEAPDALIYRHSDGYPDGEHGVPACLARFFADVIAQTGGDTRFSDPSYLAAKFVVWQMALNGSAKAPLASLGCGVVMEAPGDVAYVYAVECGTREAVPVVKFRRARGGAWLDTNGAETKDMNDD